MASKWRLPLGSSSCSVSTPSPAFVLPGVLCISGCRSVNGTASRKSPLGSRQMGEGPTSFFVSPLLAALTAHCQWSALQHSCNLVNIAAIDQDAHREMETWWRKVPASISCRSKQFGHCLVLTSWWPEQVSRGLPVTWLPEFRLAGSWSPSQLRHLVAILFFFYRWMIASYVITTWWCHPLRGLQTLNDLLTFNIKYIHLIKITKIKKK